MIGTIRKHSKWLLWVIAILTIASFVFFMGSGPARMGSGGSRGVDTNTIGGEIYGHKVTPEWYSAMQHDVDLYFLFNYGNWATRNPNVTHQMMMEQIYERMMLEQKAKDVGIHIGDDQVEQAAANYLRSPSLLRALGVRADSVPLNDFVQQVLTPENLTAADFENFVRDDLAVNQLTLIYGMPGLLITPQEAANEYVRQYRELSVQAVFISASNYLSQISVAPAEVGMFYTNYMADYRLPDRRQVDYVLFSVTNYLAAAEHKLEETNFDAQVNIIYNQYGSQIAPDAKTPDEVKAVIRKDLIRREALSEAGEQAGEFAQAVYNVSSTANKAPSADDLSTVARQQGLTVQTTAPFAADYGPQEFTAPPVFTKTAFTLSPDSPISEPIGGSDGVYIMALKGIFPSEIPPLDEIRGQVAQDLQLREASVLAQRVGTNFTQELVSQMSAGKSFYAASEADGFVAQTLPPFSLSTQEMPELENRATLNQVKQAAFTTPVGAFSPFVHTDDGGFVLYIKDALPIDQTNVMAALPRFTEELRQQRQSQTFDEWVQREASRELRDTPLANIAGASSR